MPDEAVPAEQDTPTPEQAAPDNGTPAAEPTDGSQPAPEDNWQKRYTDLQPEYTRASQEAAQYRNVIELARQGDREAIEALGLPYDFDFDGEDDEEEEPQFHDPRVDDLIAEREQRQQEHELDNLERDVERNIDTLAKAAGIELDDDEIDLIFGALTQGEDGQPDVEGAFKKVTGIGEKAIKQYTQRKRRVPSAPSGGSPSHQPDLDDPEQRRNWIAERLGT